MIYSNYLEFNYEVFDKNLILDFTKNHKITNSLFLDWWTESKNINFFTNKFTEFLTSTNCKILQTELFGLCPGEALMWHTDINHLEDVDSLTPHTHAKINFIVATGQKCYLEYGMLKNHPTGLITFKNSKNRKFYLYDSEEMIITERTSIHADVLTNGGYPHRVVNESEDFWCCLSCIIGFNNNNKLITFEEAKNILGGYLK